MPITISLTSTSSTDVSTLLRKATELKNAGKIDAAVETLRQTYSAISKTSIDYGVETFLRLPLYLQAAGRNDEAWREFNFLLTHGYPNQPVQPGARDNVESKIYDKMRLFLLREGKHVLAVTYGALAYVSDLRGRYLGGQKDPVLMQYFKQYSTKETYTSIFTKLVKKAKKMDKLPEICEIVGNFISKLPEGDDILLKDSIERILNE
jgi:hypothetical protein